MKIEELILSLLKINEPTKMKKKENVLYYLHMIYKQNYEYTCSREIKHLHIKLARMNTYMHA